jgi:hypothetical protein
MRITSSTTKEGTVPIIDNKPHQQQQQQQQQQPQIFYASF